jgi:hypothetical protein
MMDHFGFACVNLSIQLLMSLRVLFSKACAARSSLSVMDSVVSPPDGHDHEQVRRRTA